MEIERCDQDHSVEHLESQAQDISLGAEPSPVLLEAAGHESVNKLRQDFHQYVTDSILPDGTPLSQAPYLSRFHPEEDNENEAESLDSDDEQGSEDNSPGGCACHGPTPCCSVADGDVCDCVQRFGNFYAQSSPENSITLNLDALPVRLPLVECGASCSCTTNCTNRTTQRGVQTPIFIRQSTAGLGAFLSLSSPSIPRGTFIALYAGEYLSTSEARARWGQHKEDNYTLSLRLSDQTIHIDPRFKGNVGRFLNHSCDPNCVILIVYWGAGWPRAAIFTKRTVAPAEELTFDYGSASGQEGEVQPEDTGAADPRGRTKCLCGSSRCRGFMPFDETL